MYLLNQLFVRKKNTKTSHKLSKAENVFHVGSNNSLYNETKKSENSLNKNNVKITKRAHAFKGSAGSCNAEILNSFNPEKYWICNWK